MRVFRAAQKTLRDLEASYRLHPTPEGLVACRWVKQASDALLDRMFRFSLLEGVAGLSEGQWGRWSDNPKDRSAEREEQFKGSDMNPLWLGTTNTGIYKAILNSVTGLLASAGVENVSELNATDILNNGFKGIGKSGTRKRMLPSVGAKLSAGILSGKETPRSAARMATAFFRKMALNEIKTYRRTRDRHRLDYGDDGDSGSAGIEDKGLWEKDRGQWFARLMFDATDPLGRKIIRWVHKFLSKQKGSKYLIKWFEMSLRQRRAVLQREVAEVFGIKAEGLGRYFRPALDQLADTFWDSPLAEELQDKFMAEGGTAERQASVVHRLQVLQQVRAFFSA